ncbi:hypothetical protein MPER_09365, partial [Moniliophthora perniciosa FA553]
VQLGRSLFPLFALALDLPENFFDDKTTKPAAIMRLLHYPPQNPTKMAEDGSVIGIGAHTDYEDAISGLQVQNNDGKWIDAVPIPGTVVVNLGDQFARWTNDIFKSTLHRVINKSGMERYSIPLFFGTNYDVLLEYEVVSAGDSKYLFAYLGLSHEWHEGKDNFGMLVAPVTVKADMKIASESKMLGTGVNLNDQSSPIHDIGR